MQQHILVDGYSIIHHWDEFRQTRGRNLAIARQSLILILTKFQDYDKRPLTLVFDGRSLPKSGEAIQTGIDVVYTKKDQTADAYIEKLVGQSGKPASFIVATEDMAEQSIIESLGGRTMSADIFHAIVVEKLDDLSLDIQRIQSGNRPFGRR